MNIVSILRETFSCDFSHLEKKMDKSEEMKRLGFEVQSWFNNLIKDYRAKENNILKSPIKNFYFDMKKASNFTLEFYKLPRFSESFVREHLPRWLYDRLKERFKNDTNILCAVYFWLDELIDIDFLLGGEVWSHKLFKDAQVTKEMKEIESKKEEYISNEINRHL